MLVVGGGGRVSALFVTSQGISSQGGWILSGRTLIPLSGQLHDFRFAKCMANKLEAARGLLQDGGLLGRMLLMPGASGRNGDCHPGLGPL